MLTFALMGSLPNLDRVVHFGVFEVDLAAGQLRKHGTRIRIQGQPFQILLLLLENPGEVVTRDYIQGKLWTDHTFVDFDRSLNTAITKLRMVLSDSANNPRFIETIPRQGYRFIAPVSTQYRDNLPLRSSTTPVALPVVPAHDMRPAAPNESSKTVPKWVWIASLTAAVGLVTVMFYPRLRKDQNLPSPHITSRRSVAVLGFKNLTAESGHAWLSTAISDWLSAELAAGDQLRAIPEENVARMKIELGLPDVDSLSRDSLRRVRQNLGSDLVVIGSYASLGDKTDGKIRVDIHLQDTATGETIATISQVGTQAQLLDLISGTGEHLRATLGVRPITPQESAAVAIALPSNPDAARFYSEGLARLRIYDALGAVELFRKSNTFEPDFALSHSALSTALSKLGYDAAAVDEGKKATELSSKLPRAERLLVEARYHQVSKQWDKAIETYRALSDFFPDSVDYGLALAQAQIDGGRGRDALETVASLHRLPSPATQDGRIDLAEAAAADSQGDLRHALNAADIAASKARTASASLLLAEALMIRSHMLQGLGDLPESAAAIAQSEQIFQTAGAKGELAKAEARSAAFVDRQGDFSGAKQTYEKSLAVFRSIGDQRGVAIQTNNIGVELENLGDLNGAKGRFLDSLAASSGAHDQWDEAIARANLGEILFDLGDLRGSRLMYEQSLAICNSIGNQDLGALDLAGLALVLEAQGELNRAWQDEEKAMSIFSAVGQVHTDVDVASARLLLHMGKVDEALIQIRKALDLVNKTKATNDLPNAEATLAQILLAQGNLIESRQAAERATAALGTRSTLESRLVTEIAAGQVLASSNNQNDRAEAVKELARAIEAAQQAGFIAEEFDARLVYSKLLAADAPEKARREFTNLQNDASARGWTLIAHSAASQIQVRPHSKS